MKQFHAINKSQKNGNKNTKSQMAQSKQTTESRARSSTQHTASWGQSFREPMDTGKGTTGKGTGRSPVEDARK
jgi:hypothetical protein